MSWKEMIQVERGADITEMEAPIPSTIGEGFTFSLNGKQYTTIGDYTKGKRNVEFCITSYIGYCGGAEHYYCSISVRKGTKVHNILERLMPLKGVKRSYGAEVCYRVPKSEFEKEEL